jgi:thiaminase/transcriptional activator TenA
MAGLSQHLFTLGRANLGRQLAHPTVRGIANGNLERARFRAWLVQDYLFLLDYVRLFALAAARAADTDTLGRLVDLAHATFHQELSLHRAYAAEFGLGEADLDRAEKSPTCAAYTDFLLRTAATAEFAEVLAALLPCMWGYAELGGPWPWPACRPSPATDAGSRPTPTPASPPWPPGARPCWTGRPTACQRPTWPPASVPS